MGPMIYDRLITISAAGSRRAIHWPAQTLLWSELAARLQMPVRGEESHAEYMRWPKQRQDDAKDVGGFVAGTLEGGRRKAGCVTGRDVVTLDLDNLPAGSTDSILQCVAGLGCGYAIYSTRKHDPAAPRLRVLIPLARTVTADEYEPLARALARWIDPSMQPFDPSTFEASRLMYWPSCSADSQYVCACDDRPMVDVDGVLATYTDWHDMSQWPQVPGTQERRATQAAKQEDPVTKRGIVGAFCRVYDIYRALQELLPGIYTVCDTGNDRLTYAGGSTTGGAVIYDNGKYLYSHHATDPAGGKLCNAWDLVRIHKFGDLDNEAKPDTPVNKLPSYLAMCKFAGADADVLARMDKERYEQAVESFAAEATGSHVSQDSLDTDWMRALRHNTSTGAYEKTIDNIWIVLEHDPQLKGRFALNEFANRGEVFGALPWDTRTIRRQWEDNDNYGLYWYLEKVYNITGNPKIDGALSLHSKKHSFNEVQDYLKRLKWDGTPRLDTLFIDYLGAADTPYTRAVTRKAFTAAVARAMAPGTKFDVMTVVTGPQGIGKSTLFRIMSRGWFSDSLRTFEGKEASELIQGVWIVEIGELGAMRRDDVNHIKQFLSQQTDRYRAAYARNVKECPRCCVFFGTSNDSEYLRDKTGNRRFWPIDVVQPARKGVFTELESEVDQLWAEAVAYWQIGEPLYLEGAVAAQAHEEQEGHRERSPMEGLIQDFIEKPIPKDWNNWELPRRLAYWANGIREEDASLVPRDRVCAIEVWVEALGNDKRNARRQDIGEINAILAALPGWTRMPGPARFGCWALQRGFSRECRYKLCSTNVDKVT